LLRSVFLRILSLLVLTGAFSGQNPAVYYVDAGHGDDANPGTASAPWKTIQKAANSIEGGGQVNVNAGTYDEQVTVSRSGSAGAFLTFQAQGNVVMQGFIILADYVRIVGFEITNSNVDYETGNGVAVLGRFNEIRNNYIHDLLFGEGIWLYGGPSKDSSLTSNNLVIGNRIARARIAAILVEGVNNVIDGNDISHTVQDPPGSPPRMGADADGIRFFGSGHILRHNYIHNITIDDVGNTNPHIDAFQTWGPSTNITIEQNEVWQIGQHDQGIIIEGLVQPVDNIMIRNNVFMTNGTGYAPAVLAGDNGPVTNVHIVNNTMVALNGPAEFAIWLFANLNGAVIRNNAIHDHGNVSQPYIRIDPGASSLDIGFNAISKTDGLPPAGSPYPGDLWMIDPRFLSIVDHDFRLLPGSPLIDAGSFLPDVLNDFDSLTRPIGGVMDIGAFEYQ
jgi:hypothetical protein